MRCLRRRVLVIVCFLLFSEVMPVSASELFTDTREYTDLWNYISAKRWSDALARLESNPEESSILIVRRGPGGRRKGGRIETRSLPLHRVFSVDLCSSSSTFSKEDAFAEMTSEQVQVIETLLHVFPDAAAVTDVENRLPLHLAGYSSLPPPTAIIRSLIDAYPGALDALDNDGRCPLHASTYAPTSSYLLIKELATSNKGAVIKTDADGSLPIHLVSWGGGVRSDTSDTFKMLLLIHTDGVRATDGDGDTPFTLMTKYGRTNMDVFRFMLEFYPKGVDEVIDAAGNTPLHSCLSGARHGLLAEMVDILLDTNVNIAQIANKENGMLPLHSALDQCCVENKVVLRLIDAHHGAVTVKDARGYLPLHHACSNGVDHVDIFRVLLELYPEGASTTLGDGRWPLHLALNTVSRQIKGDSEHCGLSNIDEGIVLILEYCPKSSQMIDPKTNELPLHTAIKKYKPPAVIQKLIDAASNTKQSSPESQENSLHVLAEVAGSYTPAEATTIVEALLRTCPECVNEQNDKGQLPIHVACQRGSLRPGRVLSVGGNSIVVDRLVRANPDTSQVKDKSGNLPVHYASKNLNAEAVTALLKTYPEGASIPSDETGGLALHMVCDTSPLLEPHGTEFENAKALNTIVMTLLPAYTNSTIVADKRGKSPLHVICSSAFVSRSLLNETINAVLKANPASVKTRDAESNLPLHLALKHVKFGSNTSNLVYLIQAMLERYPESASARDNRGNLPLHLALLYSDEFHHIDIHKDATTEIMTMMKTLFRLYSDAASTFDVHGRLPVHYVAKVIGDLGGIGNLTLWESYLQEIVSFYPNGLEIQDKDGRTPLQILSFHLRSAVSSTSERRGPSLDRNEVLDRVICSLLSTKPRAINIKDNFGKKPADIVKMDRATSTMGNDLGEMHGSFTFLKRAIARGESYWNMVGQLNEIQSMLLSRHSKETDFATIIIPRLENIYSKVDNALQQFGKETNQSRALLDFEVGVCQREEKECDLLDTLKKNAAALSDAFQLLGLLLDKNAGNKLFDDVDDDDGTHLNRNKSSSRYDEL